MNQRILKRAGWGIAAIMALTLNATDLKAANGKAIVRAIRGPGAEYSSKKGEDWTDWSKLRVGHVLFQNSRIRTSDSTVVDLFLGRNGPVVRVTETSGLGLDNLTFEETDTDTIIDTQLDLTDGRILGRVKSLAQASTYEVKTPSAVVGIRGTEYDISVDSTTTIIEGTAVVAYSSGGTITTHTVQQAQTFNPGNRQVVAATPAVTAPIEASFQEIRPLSEQTEAEVVEVITQETGEAPAPAPAQPEAPAVTEPGTLPPVAEAPPEPAVDPNTDPRIDPETGEEPPATPDGPVETSVPAA